MKPRLWAPFASRVEIEILNQDPNLILKMDPVRSINSLGWFELQDIDLKPGTDYRFILDKEQVVPDPRSVWQPEGVHGPSRVVDHNSYNWQDDTWKGFSLSSAVIYECHVGTFTPEGTFKGVMKKLDYLIELGINTLELMPVSEFPGRWGWGYDGVDLYAVRDSYGGPQGLKELVDSCHQKGIAVVLDVVYNHFGPSGNYLSKFGPYFSDKYSTPWGDAINLDESGSDEVRNFLIDNAVTWFKDFHFDALRLDAIHAIFDTSATHFLTQLSDRIQDLSAEIGKPCYLIAESDLNNPRVISPIEIDGFGFDSQWSDDFHHSLWAILTNETNGYYADFGTIADLAEAFKSAFVYKGQYSIFRNRSHGSHPVNKRYSNFLAYIQDHDQVGNRAIGDRLSHVVDLDFVKMAAGLVLVSGFIPMIFQGEEWAASTPFLYFSDHSEPELGQAVTQGRQKEFASFGWDPSCIPDPQSESSFLNSKLNWDELGESKHQELLQWYKDLLRLRKDGKSLGDCALGKIDIEYSEEEKWLIIRKSSKLAIVNFSDSKAGSNLSWIKNSVKVLLSSQKVDLEDLRKGYLPPKSFIFLELN